MMARRWLIRGLWAALIAAALIVALTPAPEPGPPPAAVTDPWALPRLAAGNSAGDLAELLRGNLWSGQAQSDAQVDERARRWRLAGTAGPLRERVAIVQFGDGTSQTLKAGDHLPDGTLIGEIRDNGVCVIIDGKKRLLPLPGQTVPTIW